MALHVPDRLTAARSWVILIRDAWKALQSVPSDGYTSEAECIRAEWCAANAHRLTSSLETGVIVPELATEWIAHRDATVISHIIDAQNGAGPLAKWWANR
jgi:hypothetical protein